MLDELVTTLLWEGYALYPYTPGAIKNATPTPFGIVYPPAYAQGSPTTFDRIRMQGIADGPADATLAMEVAFLQGAEERRVTLPATPLGQLEIDGVGAEFAFGEITGRVRMAAQRFDERLARVTMCVHNTTPIAAGVDRTEALGSSLLSTHVVARVEGAKFLSPIDPPESGAAAVMACAAVNTFPVLGNDDDTALLGAAIMLPDHPEARSREPRRPLRRDGDRGGGGVISFSATLFCSAGRGELHGFVRNLTVARLVFEIRRSDMGSLSGFYTPLYNCILLV